MKNGKSSSGKNEQIYASHDNVPNQKLFHKNEKYDELDSIEKDKDIFSTISIEQDIANLDNIGHVDKQGDQFVLEFDECDNNLRDYKAPSTAKNSDRRHAEKLQFHITTPNKPRNYAPSGKSPARSAQPQQSQNSMKRLNRVPSQEELKNKQMIMEYLKVVKEKSQTWAVKLEEAQKEAEYYKAKSTELETAKDKVIEREKVMAMKYGIIFSQNKELMAKLVKRKQENEELKKKLSEHIRTNSLNDVQGDQFMIRMNSTIHNREDSSPVGKRMMPTSYSTSSFITNYNPAEHEAIDKYVESLKNVNIETDIKDNKSSDSDPKSADKPDFTKLDKPNISPQNDSEETPNNLNTKVLVNRLLWEQKQRLDTEEQNAKIIEEM